MPKFQMILGSRSFLKTFFNRYDTPLVLLKSLQKSNYALLDPNMALTFAAPLKYTALITHNQLPTRGYFQFLYFRLTEDDAPVFVAKAKKLISNAVQLRGSTSAGLYQADTKVIEYLLLITWDQKLDVFASKNTPLMAATLAYTPRAAQSGGFHEAIYQAVDPNAKRTVEGDALNSAPLPD